MDIIYSFISNSLNFKILKLEIVNKHIYDFYKYDVLIYLQFFK